MNYPNKMSHIIVNGDNLYQLSKLYQTTVPAILNMNPNLDPYNLPIGKTIFIIPGENFYNKKKSLFCPNPAIKMALAKDMRLAWAEHIFWTRMVIISILERLPDQNETVARLLKNPEVFANIFSKYYSESTAQLISNLLTEHLKIGGDFFTALRDNNSADAENLKRQWYANADKMAHTFSNINPYYAYDEMKKMLYSHLDLLTQITLMRLAKNYSKEIMIFDKSVQEAMEMADAFASGIIKQFPHKFN